MGDIETERGLLSLRTMAMPNETNPFGDMFGGWMMSQMDLAAGWHAMHRARGRVATVAVDAMTFHAPVFVGDEVSCYTKIEKVGTTSITLKVEVWVRRLREDDGLRHEIKVTEARFVMVAMDRDGNKRPVPPEKSDA